ncbi:MBL fold metallo-hydrolase [Pendulispora albinea]|uniref:MBL fold metallo-hydrolase n=1 Tax=Pendulispora albinea TaxID=2741071 RepID=A0ABZ2M9D6_9BACT
MRHICAHFVRSSFLLSLSAAIPACSSNGAAPDPGVPAASVEALRDSAAAWRLLESTLTDRPLAALTSFRYETKGSRYFPTEALLPNQRPLHVNDFTATGQWDVTGDRSRLDVSRQLTALGAMPPQAFSLILVGPLGRITGDEGVGQPPGNLPSDGSAAARREQRLLHPHLLVRDARREGKTVKLRGASIEHGEVFVDLALDDAVHPISFHIRLRDHELVSLSTKENNHLTRDIGLEITFAGWKTVGGFRIPAEVRMLEDGAVVHQEKRTKLEANVALPGSLFDLPGDPPAYDAAAAERAVRSHQTHQQYASFGFRNEGDGVQEEIGEVAVAPGATLLTGNTHNTMLIERANGLVLGEAPLYEQRSEALLRYVRTKHPGKPITHVIATHWHEDHAGGLRRFAALGATIVVSETTRDFFERIFAAPSTIVPDVMSSAPVKAKFLTVPSNAPLTLPDAVRPLVLYPIANTHAADMIAVHLPRERVLFEADLFSPPYPPYKNTWTRELYDAIAAQHIDVGTIAGVHGRTGSFEDLKAAAGVPR